MHHLPIGIPHTAMVVAVIILAIALAWYFSGQILKPAREDREAREAIEPEEQIDIWRGFAEAHENNPPVFSENDSWVVEPAQSSVQ